MMGFLGILLLLITLLLIYCCYRLYHAYGVLKRLGIPHPPVTPLMGNGIELLKMPSTDFQEKWLAKSGKVFGYYIGTKVDIVVADLDILKEIMIKQSNKFVNVDRQPQIMIEIRRNNNMGPGLLFEEGEEWKRIRRIITPTFSSKKLKLMMPLVDKSISSLCSVLEDINKKEQSVNVHIIYAQFTLETILAVAFGSEVNVLKGEGSALSEAANGFFTDLNESFLVWEDIFNCYFPTLLRFLSVIGARMLSLGKHMKVVNDTSLSIIKSRREHQMEQSHNGNKREDFLQLLMDAEAPDDPENESSNKASRVLTDKQIVGLCLDFMIAGQETTSSLLAFTSYLLAINPQEQEQLCQAIDDYYQENENPSLYDASQSIPYLDWVIQEALRIYPPAPTTSRLCNETCTANGITIPNGCRIIIPILKIHMSPEYWDQPEVFNPKRFSPEGKEGRNPQAYIPFGSGPRSCIGMRFALMEAKACLVSILRKYRFERSPDTQVPLKMVVGFTQFPKDGIYLKIAKV
ncbi:PREDICTED: cytochrome P450 3A8-like isoform X1 [Amphimedon queenslandica]|uniref:Thromboxane-A synthase n=1 Tax=Amphimedon queenslandica TaxID=400682 RepID=A0AAN0JL13_AMPQE|nr:PREDICTED: cytochrome P450 3A8-like isoform X1 [Amphimedon queenslandica]|eukprot:XP_019857712.1 PREDICTED: cytochrome P450 3A8-like isoform X1 [Amphimedon queenslandica]